MRERDPWKKSGLPLDLLAKYNCVLSTPMELYSELFSLGKGVIQKNGEKNNLVKANPVGYYKTHMDNKQGHFRILFDDDFEESLTLLQSAEFAIMGAVTYFGRRNTMDHASNLHGIIIDLDGVNYNSIHALLNQCSSYSERLGRNINPMPNYLVFSGHGVHLYYIFDVPIPLYPYLRLQLKDLKYALTRKLWNKYTSTADNPQYQGINQGFRVAGGKTKEGCSLKNTVVYHCRQAKYSLEELNEYVPEENRVERAHWFKEHKYTIEQAKELFPEWYERVVVGHSKFPKKWDIAGKVHGDNPFALYDWWIKQIYSGATYGHRYFCILTLVIYAVKCDVPKEKLESDAFQLLDYLNDVYPTEPFTKEDILSALECYDERYFTFPIKDISKLTAIDIKRNKRNGKSQEEHLEEARAIRDVRQKRNGTVWYNTEGRPSAEQQVLEWQKTHPNGKQKECVIDLGISNKTVSKYWDRYWACHLVKKWREEHDGGTKSMCQKDTGLSYPTIRKWWYCPLKKDQNPIDYITEYRKNYPNKTLVESMQVLHFPPKMVEKVFHKIDLESQQKLEDGNFIDCYGDIVKSIQSLQTISYGDAVELGRMLVEMSLRNKENSHEKENSSE